MNKLTGVNSLYMFFVTGLAIFIFTGCSVLGLNVTSTPQSPTATPPYIHYTPSEGFNVHLEFDYPSSWVFSEDKMQGVDFFITIGLGDPRFRTLPTSPPDDSSRTPNNFGSIIIWILPSKPGQTSDTELESRKQSYSQTSSLTVMDSYKIMIDGYNAGVLEYQINDPESYSSLMFARRTFFVVEDQMYEIYFTIAEKDRGGEFEKGYEYFFNSLEIVP